MFNEILEYLEYFANISISERRKKGKLKFYGVNSEFLNLKICYISRLFKT